MVFLGSLAELHLPDIVQLMSVSGKTGVFHMTDGALAGEIYLQDGQIVHAQLGDAQGEDAVYALAIWNQGEFRFEAGVGTDARTITKSNTNLLMEAARRLDEWRMLSKKIPSVEMVPEFVIPQGREGQINLNTGEWLILSKIDGQRSLTQIAAASSLSVFDAAKMLYGLVATGLIRLKDTPATAAPAAATRSEVTPLRAAPTPAGGGAPSVDLLARMNRIRDACTSFLGSVGESVVAKHYQKARADIEKGAGAEAIDEAISQIARATSILKGPSTSEALRQQIKAIK